MGFEAHRKIILGMALTTLTFAVACSPHEHASTVAHTSHTVHTTWADHEMRQISAHKTHSTAVARDHAQRHREAVRAARKAERKRKALAYACRDMPGGQIIAGSTVAECDYNRRMTEQVLRNDRERDKKYPATAGDNGDATNPGGLTKRQAWQEYELRKKAAHDGTYGHKATHCPPGQHPGGVTGACG